MLSPADARDAHDAGRGCGTREKRGPADAHDAGRGCGAREKRGPADAHVLGVGAAYGKKGT